MKKIMYATIVLFLAILVLVIIVASFTPVRTVTYHNGVIMEEKQ